MQLMRIYNAQTDDLSPVFERTQFGDEAVISTVRGIVKDVRAGGDKALFSYVEKFDGVDLSKGLLVTQDEIRAAYKAVSTDLLDAVRRAKSNVLEFHKRQADALYKAAKDAAKKDVSWALRPVQRAGIYVPGGTAPYPSSVLMCALPAVAAGVEEIYICSPKPKNPLTLVAAAECGIQKIFKMGGAQAVAAMAYGTQSVPKADVIAGPGNVYVTLAKKEIYGDAAIDMLAGPSEVLIIADKSASPKVLAADLLSQAEHDTLAACSLVVTCAKLAAETATEVERQIKLLSRREIAEAAISAHGAVIVVKDLDEAAAISNKIAPEHLELAVEKPEPLLLKIKNAGAVFMGHYTPEPIGDYFAGPSHCLPTSGTAKYFSVLSADTFLKKMSVINYSKQQFEKCAGDVIALAEAEGFTAHANSIRVRMK